MWLILENVAGIMQFPQKLRKYYEGKEKMQQAIYLYPQCFRRLFYAAFNSISVISQWQLISFMSFLGFTSSRLAQVYSHKKLRGSSVALTQDLRIISVTLCHWARQDPLDGLERVMVRMFYTTMQVHLQQKELFKKTWKIANKIWKKILFLFIYGKISHKTCISSNLI